MGSAVQGRFRTVAFLLGASILCWTRLARAHDGNQAEVLVYNDAHIPASTLETAEMEASRILRLAGVRLVWVNCSPYPVALDKRLCQFVAGTNQFVLRVIPEGNVSMDLVFGQAFLGKNGVGKYADVFFDRIQAAHEQYGTNVPRLLGAVGAHELGHLILGFRAHSWIGIMTPVWEAECLRRMSMGSLLFTREEAARMQSRLERSETPESASNVRR
jgi:hypothetical protein